MAQAKTKTELAVVDNKTDLVAHDGNSAPAFLRQHIAEDAGKGVSSLAEDNMVPMLYVLQALSPACNKRSPDYVEGAESGSIWLKASGLPAVDGEAGILFQPCFFSKAVVEWIPRDNGGGFVAQHSSMPADAIEVVDAKNPNKKRWTMPNGNDLIETRYHTGFVLLDDRALPYVIPFSSSGHTVSRQWQFLMNSKRLGNATAPSWACLYRLKTKERTNASGTWFVLDVADAGWVQTEDDYNRGADFNAAMSSGERTIDVADVEPHMEHSDSAAM